MPNLVPGHGPKPACIVIVGEAPGFDEDQEGRPFVGSSGRLLTAMLVEAGIVRSECYVTNVCKFRPRNNDINEWFKGDKLTRGCHASPEMLAGVEELEQELLEVQPNVVIALGNTALWALTDCAKPKAEKGKKIPTGIGTWRGSVLKGRWGYKVIPAYHPAAILRQWSWRPILIRDLQRAQAESGTAEIHEPPYRFIVRPSFEQAKGWLEGALERANRGAARRQGSPPGPGSAHARKDDSP